MRCVYRAARELETRSSPTMTVLYAGATVIYGSELRERVATWDHLDSHVEPPGWWRP